MNVATDNVTNSPKLISHEHWLMESLDKFSKVMYFQEDQDLSTWGDIFLQKLIPYIDGLQAILYSKINDKLSFMSSYALDDFSKQKMDVIIADGLISQAIKNNEMCYFTGTNIHYQPHAATVGFMIEGIIVLPLAFNKKVCGVLEILFHQKPEQKYIDLLQQLSEKIAANLNMRLILNSLEESYREIEKNNSIMESIRYAKRIQDAFLPSCEQRKKIFPDSFVIYKPLHTVSGDFYWVSEHENLKIACIVDCTGHGIPAAFLSLLANSLLTEAIIHNKIFSPTLVIAWLHRGIQQRLQSGDDKLKDGMDLGICVIEYLNKQEVKIVYEGTKHILFVTRNGKVARYNSSRLNLGYSEKFFRVEDKEFLLQRNDMLYLTTDGYIDQADAKRQRFGSAKFTQLIAENHDKTITEQKSIFEETLGEHSNNAIQRDDITVFGIQL